MRGKFEKRLSTQCNKVAPIAALCVLIGSLFCLRNAPYDTKHNMVPASLSLNYPAKIVKSLGREDTVQLAILLATDTIISKKYQHSVSIVDTLELPIAQNLVFHASVTNDSSTLIFIGDTTANIPETDFPVVALNMALVAPSPVFTDTVMLDSAALGGNYLDTLHHVGPAGILRSCTLLASPAEMTLLGDQVSWVPADTLNQTIVGMVRDEYGQSDTLQWTVSVKPPDTESPIVVITSPTTADTYSTSANSISISGTAYDNDRVTGITYVLSGATDANGIVSGTKDWTVSNLALDSGQTKIMVVASDSSGNVGKDSLTVLRRIDSLSQDTSLIAFYPFNGDANDESGNGHHAVNHGGNPASDRFGNAKKALSFNGSTQYAFAKGVGALLNGVRAMTLAFWLKQDGTDLWTSPVSFGSKKFRVERAFSTSLAIYDCGFTANAFRSPQNALLTNQWQFAAITAHDTVARFYLDNKEVTQVTINGGLTCGPHVSIASRDTSAGPQMWKGAVDDIRIYNRGLTATEIDSLYKLGGWTGSTPVPTSGLLAYYPFSDSAKDESGNAHHGTVNGATPVFDRFGNANAAYGFDGSADYITVSSTPGWKFASFTAICWINTTDDNFPDVGMLLGPDEGRTPGFRIHLGHNADPQRAGTISETKYRLDNLSTSEFGSNVIGLRVDDGNWHMVAFVRDTIAASGKLYVDNAVVQEKPDISGGMTITRPYQFGSSASGNSYNGLLDDIGIYNRALSASQIDSLYRLGGWPRSGAWVTKTPMPTARCLYASGVINGKMYVAGGNLLGTGLTNVLEAYDPVSDAWSTKAPMPTTRNKFGAGAIDGKLYAIGGNVIGANTPVNEEYDPTLNAWTTKTPIPYSAMGFATGVISKKIYVVDGAYYNGRLEVYDPALDSWQTKKSMPTVRRGGVAGVVDGKLYVIGGSNKSGSVLNTVEEYDPLTDSWSTKSPMPTPRASAGICVLNEKIIVMGGSIDNPNITNKIEAYDPKLNQWTTLDSMSLPRTQFDVGVMNGKAYLVGGNTGSAASNLVEEYATITETGSVPTNGLVAYYPFNNSPNDESGNGNHGTVNGATPTADRFGNVNRAYSFDGADDEIDCGNAVSLQSSKMSVFCWYKYIGDLPISHPPVSIISKYKGYNDGYGLALFDSHVLTFATKPGAASSSPRNVGTPQFEVNKWYFIGFTYDGSKVRSYFDGTEFNYYNYSMGAPTTSNLKIGHGLNSSFGPARGFTGVLDDVRVYDRALSPAEIMHLFQLHGWTANTFSRYAIEYKASNSTSGSVPRDSGEYTIGQKVTVLPNSGNLAKAGHMFFGWNDEADGTGMNFLEGTEFSMPGNNVILYARWVDSASLGTGDFLEMKQGQLAASGHSRGSLGDIDNDGDLDFILSGGGATRIYENDGTGSFIEIDSNLIAPMNKGNISLGDLDRDGDLDVLLVGNGFSRVYLNSGTGSFSEFARGQIIGVGAYEGCSAALGDIDGDGDLDAIVAGRTSEAGGPARTKMYRNDGTATFQEINEGQIFDTYNCAFAFGDIDNDSDIDLVVSGWYGGGFRTSVYENDGSGSFSEANSGSITGLMNGCIVLGDIDNDNDMDMIISGQQRKTLIYQNDGSGYFQEINPGSLANAEKSSIGLGDIDGDADLDIILIGHVSVGKIYRNAGDGSFTEINAGQLSNAFEGSVSMGDLDCDGDLDVIITGFTTYGPFGNPIAKTYFNN